MSIHNKKKLELKKHIATIHCSNSLTLIQRKISNALLYHAYPEMLEKDKHIIEIRQLCSLIGYSSHDYQLIKNSLRKLLSIVLEWNILKEDQKSDSSSESIWTASSILASVSINGSVCTYTYSSHMKQLLYTPSMYGRIDMTTQARFKSGYALALYENCVRYQDLPYTSWFRMEIFRKLMGVDDEKYKIFRDFKRRIIDKAVEEVNKYSHLSVEAETKKENKKIVSIRFKIQKQTKMLGIDNAKLTQSEKFKTWNDALTAWGMPNHQIEALRLKYGVDNIKNVVDIMLNNENYKKNLIFNPISYFMAILEKKLNDNITINKNNNYDINTGNQLSNVRKKYNHYVFNIIKKHISKDIEKYYEVVNLFEAHLQENYGQLLWKYYNKYQFDHWGVQTEFIIFIKKQYVEYFVSIPTYEQFVKDYCE